VPDAPDGSGAPGLRDGVGAPDGSGAPGVPGLRDDLGASGAPVLIEGGDLGCARLLVLLRDRARELPEGTEVHLSTSDPVAPIDLPAWCRMTGHTYLGPVEGAAVPTYAVRITAAPRATDPARPWHLAD
jgi:tRNA 2-thiouridine synthesizing protein A